MAAFGERPAGDASSAPSQVLDAAPSGGLGDYTIAVFAFVGSGCLLVLEIVAGRLLAPTLGVSLYTWTSVIGVVLAGVTLGNFAGGRLADRRPHGSTVAAIYVAGSVTSIAILALLPYVNSIQLPTGAPAIVQVLWLTALLFLLPSSVLAAATPVLTRLSLHSVQQGGRVVGRIQAAAALGSITGTFLTGFVLVSAFGTRQIVAGVAVTMLLLAVLAHPPWLRTRVYELGSLLAVLLASGAASHSECLRESNYYCIVVQPVSVGVASKAGTPRAIGEFRALYLDHLLHSVTDLSDPTVLFYEYEQLYAQAIARLHPAGSRLDTFFVGGGGYVFPRYVEATYTGRIVVAEIDPAVTGVAQRYLGLAATTRIETRHDDARQVLRSLPDTTRFDLVFGDAFDDFEVPFQLTTRQFNELVARHLKPHGLYLLNVVDSVHFDFLRSELRTLRLTFPYVRLMAVKGDWPPKADNRTTYVILAAAHAPGRSLPVVAPREVNRFIQEGHSVVLTDNHVPVDQLLAPVFSQALGER